MLKDEFPHKPDIGYEKRLYLEKSSVSRLVGGLERRGLVVCTKFPGDSRHKLVSPTSKALEEAQRCATVAGAVLKEAQRGMTDNEQTEEYRCPGGVFYCSMMKPNLRFIERYVTTGFDGTPVHGERYLPSPEAVRTFLDKVNPRKAPPKYCIFKPLSLYEKMLAALPNSMFNMDGDWPNVRKKVARSAMAWGEDE